MLSKHCFRRSGIYGNFNSRATCHAVPKTRAASSLVAGCRSNVCGSQLLGSSNNRATRWFSQSPTKPAKKLEIGIEDGALGGRVTRGTTAPSALPRSSPLDASSQHNSLQSFQAYSRRTGLSTTSTVYTGTSYEYLTQSTLKPYGFDLYRVGGRGDRGVDLIGIWRIPLLSSLGQWKEKSRPISEEESPQTPAELEGYETQPLKVLVQCKRLVGKSAKIGPHLIRELDGAVRGARSAAMFDVVWPQNAIEATTTGEQQTGIGSEEEMTPQTPLTGQAVGVLVSTKPATKGVVDSMRRSSRGLVWIMMEEITDKISESGIELEDEGQDEPASRPPPGEYQSESDNVDEEPIANLNASTLDLRGRVKQVLWNQAARDLGLEGVSVVKRYDVNGREDVVLMRGDRVWGGS